MGHSLAERSPRSSGPLQPGWCSERLTEGEHPVRFVVCSTDPASQIVPLRGRASSRPRPIRGPGTEHALPIPSIFEFRKRPFENSEHFNVVFLVPTGINATIGGHAGDAGPVARLLASVCDTLILHPNVVNASDINEMPENALYVEGSVICRLLMGTAGLRRVRSNRVLVVIDRHEEIAYSNAAINAVNAARACYGFDCPADRHARPSRQAGLGVHLDWASGRTRRQPRRLPRRASAPI